MLSGNSKAALMATADVKITYSNWEINPLWRWFINTETEVHCYFEIDSRRRAVGG